MSVLPSKILVWSDGSKSARRAIRFALAMSDKIGAEVHLMHVGLVSQFTNPDNMSPNQYQRLRHDAEEALAAEVEWTKENCGGREFNGVHMKMGRADGEVMKLAENMRVGLIVVGSRNMWEIERVLLGNDAESIVRHAHCPVLVVRETEE